MLTVCCVLALWEVLQIKYKIQAPVLRKFVVHTRFQHSGGRTKDRYFMIFRVIESVGTNQLVTEARMAPYRIYEPVSGSVCQ